MKQGSIYMVSLDPTVGREQFGYRPVLVLSPDRFNHLTDLPVVAPITNGAPSQSASDLRFHYRGTKTTGIVRCDQPRICDLEERRARFVEIVPDVVLFPVLELIRSIFNM